MNLSQIYNSVKEMLTTMVGESFEHIKGDFLSPEVPYSIPSFVLLPILVFIVVKFKIGFDYIGTLEPQYRNNRSWRATWHWIVQKNVIFTKSTRQDLKVLILNYILTAPLLYFSIPYTATAISKYLEGTLVSAFNINPAILQVAEPSLGMDVLYILGVFLAYDFGYWVIHYCAHKFPFLWEFHKVHHSAKVLTGFTTAREHIVDTFSIGIVPGVAMLCSSLAFSILLGYTPSGFDNLVAYYLIGVVSFTTSVIFHSPIWISFGKMDYFLNSPANHVLHHSDNPKHYNKNFGSLFSFFDVLFGTFVKPDLEPKEKLTLGVSDGYDWDNASMMQLLVSPFKRSFKTLTGKKDAPSTENKAA